jgi:hypothetical protein
LSKQGGHDGQSGVFHIHAMDTVTQWEVAGCVETISERHLIPVREAMLHQLPFRLRGFHCDNGSADLNRQVVRLLNKLLVEEFTKSRALPDRRQGAGGGQERGAGAQADRLRPDRRRARGSLPEPVSELPPPVRVRRPGKRCARQAQACLPAPGLPHPLPEAHLWRTGPSA